jgi:DNA-binding transcriptional ArsR family regulator
MADDPQARWPLAPDPDRDVVLDSRSLRAVAHPVRLRILGLLRMDGPSTATALAARLGLNSGATSYHLRQLASGGLIVEDAERGTGRDRWWKAAHRSSYFTVEGLAEEDTEAGVAYLRSIALVYAEKMQLAAEERPSLPTEWQDASSFGDYPLMLTAEEAKQLLEDLREVVSRYRAFAVAAGEEAGGGAAPPTEARPYHVQLQAFPRPGFDMHAGQERPDEPAGDATEGPAHAG